MPNSPNSQKLLLHLKQARHNEKLARGLIKAEVAYQDWVMTMLFYAAHHYVRSKLPHFPDVHSDAVSYINKKFGAPAAKQYKALLDKSWNARYYPHIAEQYRKNPKIVEDALGNLDKFKQHIGIKS